MIAIILPESEYFDESKQEFIRYPSQEVILEHSLVSVSKWESATKRPFHTKGPNTVEESLMYISMMQVDSHLPQASFSRISQEDYNRVKEYINDSQTATWFSDEHRAPGREIITSELIYYWMVSFQVDFRCEKWHLNRLLTLLRVCGEKNKPKKKMNQQEVASRYRSLNEQRKKAMNSNG